MASFLFSFQNTFRLVNMAFGEVSKRKVKVSKNKKKSWNKHCDVKEVEDYLEEKRFEERIGWPLSGKSSEELFFQDVSGTEKLGTGKPKRIVDTLRCHQNLGAYSNVPIPVNTDVNRYPKKIKKVLEKKADKRAKKITAQKSEENKKSDGQNETFKDPWAEDEEPDEEIKDLIIYRDEITEKRTPKVPCHRYQKPSLLPSVEVPHAGASYNPAFEDHQELLHKAVEVEEKHLKDELHLKRVLNDMFPSKANAPTEKSILEEMSQGLFDEEDKEEDENVNHFALRNPPVLAEDRLPKSRHRKRKELKEEARIRAVEKLHKQRLHEIYRIPSLKSEIKKEQELTKQRMKKRCERKIEKMYNPKTLSGYKYEAPDIEVNLTDEITGSLRKLKADGNLIEDRYKSFQRRNLIEPRIKQKMKRKYKLKRQVKRSHRNFE